MFSDEQCKCSDDIRNDHTPYASFMELTLPVCTFPPHSSGTAYQQDYLNHIPVTTMYKPMTYNKRKFVIRNKGKYIYIYIYICVYIYSFYLCIPGL